MSSYLVVLNKETWNAFTPDQQAAFNAATEYAFEHYMAPGRYDDGLKAIEVFRNNGLEIITLPEDELVKISAINNAMQEEYAAKVPGGMEALALLKELTEKYNALY